MKDGISFAGWARGYTCGDLPDGISGQDTAGEEHADVHRGGLDDGADCDGYTHQLHEPDASELVADKGLGEGAAGLAGDVDGDYL